MRITIVNGFFLPIPPVRGGATEKSWYELARAFAARGHEVTFVSRRWPGWARDETVAGIRHLRLRGHDHRRSLGLNLLLDFLWSWRVFFALPDADVVVVHAVALPGWLGRLKPRAGRVVVMTGRMPKGQYRHYRALARVLAPSSSVRTRVLEEKPALAPVAKVVGYPISWQQLHTLAAGRTPRETVTLGYIGRLHEEKGLRLLVDALALLARESGLPAWRVAFTGPVDVARGGSGPAFRDELAATLAANLPAGSFAFHDPVFDAAALGRAYRDIDVFCYPSLAEQGETFGVAVAEAMAAGAVPVVSQLACFTDFVRDEANGLVFDHRAPDAVARLARALSRLLRDPALRAKFAAAAGTDVRRYDHAVYADALLADFARLTDPANPASSAP